MVKSIALGVWAVLVSFVTLFGLTHFEVFSAKVGDEQASAVIETFATSVMRVPIMTSEKPIGYVLLNLDIDFDRHSARAIVDKLPSIAVDEVFRSVYESVAIDFSKAKKTDLAGLLRLIGERLNTRVGEGTIKEIRVREFMFVPPRSGKSAPL